MIIVGQRVATIADADKIVVLEHGEIVGSGTHDEPRSLPDLRGDRRFPAQRRGGCRMSDGRERGDQQHVVSGNGQTAPGSGNGQSAAPKAPERPKYGPSGGGGRMWGQTRPVEKSLHFLPSLRRLLGHLAPERMILSLVVLLAVIGIVMNVLGPKILGMATDVIFTGVLGKNLPRGRPRSRW